MTKQAGIIPWRKSSLLCVLVTLNGLCGCERQASDGSREPAATTSAKPKPNILIFPDSLRNDDVSVNEFVAFSMNECASGVYARFRLLWSATDDPLPRDEYEQGWQAVERIEVRALEEVRLGGFDPDASHPGETAYIVWADVSLDPNHSAGKRQPIREVILLIVLEDGQWRLSRAPRALKTWIREHVVGPPADLP